jgi:hypothetical protein
MIRDMKEYKRLYYLKNKERIKERVKEYYSRPEIKEHISKQSKEYYSRPEIKERHSKQQKEYYSRPEIKEHIYKKRKEYCSRPEIKERIYSRIARRERELGFFPISGIQFDGFKNVGHHINNSLVTWIPEIIHKSCYAGQNRETHRERVRTHPIIREFYPELRFLLMK